MDAIPIVDFGEYKLRDDEDDAVPGERLQELREEVRRAFTEVGFVYLKNTGIEQDEVDHIMAVSKKFFMFMEEDKRPYSRGSYSNSVNHGWVSLERESLNPRRPGDLKEAFNTTSLREDIAWPSEEFRTTLVTFYKRCIKLALRVLRVMALSLGIDPEVFLKAHGQIGSEENGSTLRTLYYPPVKSVKHDQIRCGEHSDYGSITLLFQSKEEGLQVKSRKGEFISAPCIPGTVLINIADLMQRWTSDVFVSSVHRVRLPPVGDSNKERQSMTFFVQPDDNVMISCCDGSNKYPPVKCVDYLQSREGGLAYFSKMTPNHIQRRCFWIFDYIVNT
uniref:Fe2OG dioxygenase domain-containing protein n=1 Tax=Pygocentrus nattereri TaxID=42514 RepID=A0AAR2KS97_PYGNA